MADSDDAAFLAALERGIALFNEQRFYDAYEVWAERWSEEVNEGADLLQGLLQIAVGFAKLSGGEPQGTAKLLHSGATKLEAYRPEAYGLDIDAVLRLVGEWQQVAERMLAVGGAAGVELPQVKLTKH